MLKQQDDSRHRNLRAKRRDDVRVDARAPDVLEATGNSLQDRDRIIALGVLTRVRIQVGGEGKDNEHKCVAHNRDEEEQALAAGCTLGRVEEGVLDKVQCYPKC